MDRLPGHTDAGVTAGGHMTKYRYQRRLYYARL